MPFKSISVFIQTTTLSPAHVSPTLGFTQTTSLVPAIFIRESNKMELSRTARVGVGLAKNLRNPKAGSIITFCDQPPRFCPYAPLKWRIVLYTPDDKSRTRQDFDLRFSR